MISYDQSCEIVNYDIEEAIKNIEKYDNITQLDILKKEISHILIHNIRPSEGWYDDRFRYIQKYSEIEWKDLAKRFHGKNDYIHTSALQIIEMCDQILEECSTHPNFNLYIYESLLYQIYDTWLYYKQLFVAEENDEDMVELVETLSRL